MLCFLEAITKWIDVGSPVDIIYLDFQKAFDKVPHQRLLLKLKAHGIGDSITDWIEQWLTDRRQRVVVDGEVSNWKSVLSGVPQGSVLGPILFLIYINDLDDSITSNVLKFADDTKLFRKVNTDGDKQHLQNDLDRLVKWSEKWQMLFNFGKCKCLHTGHGNLNVNYKMGDTVLGTTVKEKDLGVKISADMKVSEQCGIAASKGNQILGLIRRNITYKGKKLIIPLYKAIVRPHLKVKSSPRHYALGSHEGLYGQCLNLVSLVRSNLECSYTDFLLDGTLVHRRYLPNSVCTHLQLSRLRQSRVNEIA